MFALKINTKVNYQEFKYTCTILMKPNITSQHGDFHDLWINLYPQMSEYLLSLESVKKGSKNTKIQNTKNIIYHMKITFQSRFYNFLDSYTGNKYC